MHTRRLYSSRKVPYHISNSGYLDSAQCRDRSELFWDPPVTPTNKNRQLSVHKKKSSAFKPSTFCGEVGTTTIEFAFAIGLVFLLTFGLADLGRLVYTASVVRAAAQEGARTGIVDITEIAPAIVDRMVGLDSDRAQIDVSQPDQDSVAVGVTYEYQFMVPLIAMATGQDSVKLHSSASMIIR